MSLLQICVLVIGALIIYKLLYQPKTTEPRKLPGPYKLTANDIQLMENSPLYYSLGQAIVDCVAGVYQNCGLARPASLQTHMALLGQRVLQDKFGRVHFVYMFDRTVAGTGGMSFEYSTISTSTMASVLNQSIGNYALQYGVPVQKISAHGDLKRGRVYFTFVVFASEFDLQNELSTLRNMQRGY